MNLDTTQTVRELALNIPGATRVFEQLGIDYCCGGNKPLEQACGEAKLQIQHVIESLESSAMAERERAESLPGQNHANWLQSPLADLIAHIKSTHHKYVKTEIVRLRPLLDRVCNVHGVQHPELALLRSTFHALAQELTTHMMKEEMVLFPYVERMEEAVIAGEPVLPGPFGSVNKPVAAMIHEHDAAGSMLSKMRDLSDDYQAPHGACTSYKTLYGAMAEFERDLHWHVHLENNILFPRAVQMEQKSPCQH
jgi:regulator of cell morphogenesis and NO signaling